MVEADPDGDIVPPRLRVPLPARQPQKGKTAKAAKAAKAKAAKEVAKVTVHSASGEKQTLSIGDVDEDERHGKKGNQARGKYVVQVATMSSNAKAEQLRARAAVLGYNAAIH